MVTDSRPYSATSPAVVSRIASCTSRRCDSIVSFHSLGTMSAYGTECLRRGRRVLVRPSYRQPIAAAEPFEVGGDEFLDAYEVFLGLGCHAHGQRVGFGVQRARSPAQAERAVRV